MLCSLCELLHLHKAETNLFFLCVCVLLIQDSAGQSRCRPVTQTCARLLAAPPQMPLCGWKPQPFRAFYKQTQPASLPLTHRGITASIYNTFTDTTATTTDPTATFTTYISTTPSCFSSILLLTTNYSLLLLLVTTNTKVLLLYYYYY